ncbi:MAG: hypothetical protein ACTSXL_02090 [Alphaproteobacteria bacterium]|nr:MAG: hypothetical protein B6I23_02010 [Rickettsiaceae bacterium 4572_127]
MRIHGRMLLEVLLILVIIAGLLPFLHKQNLEKKTALENATIASEVMKVKSIFQNYLNESPVLFENTSTTQIKEVPFAILYDFGIPTSIKEENRFGMSYVLLARRKVLSSGTPITEGLILLSSEDIKPLQVRKIALLFGPEGGYTEDGFIYSSNQSWMDTTKAWDLDSADDSIVLKVASIQNSLGYIHRKLTGDINNQIMKTDLKMGYHNIINAGEIDAKGMEVFDTIHYENAKNGTSYGIDTFELSNIEIMINVEDCNLDESTCPKINNLTLNDITKKANIMGNAIVENTTTNEIKIKNNMILSGALSANTSKAYMADIDTLNIVGENEEEKIYDIKTRYLNIDILTIDNLETAIGMFGSVVVETVIKGYPTTSGTYFSADGLLLKNIILKNINTWIWDNKDGCDVYANGLGCASQLSTKPLFDCLTTGIEESFLTINGKGYSTTETTGEGNDVVYGFVDSVLLSDVIDCLHILTEITCSEANICE